VSGVLAQRKALLAYVDDTFERTARLKAQLDEATGERAALRQTEAHTDTSSARHGPHDGYASCAVER